MSPEAVLAFWFAEGIATRWFEPDPAFDAEVRSRLEPLYRKAVAGELDGWAADARRALAQAERMFLYLPLEHCEDLRDQERYVALMGRLDQNPEWRDSALRHRDIIARFGRFTHRNAALGRESTAEEEAFLQEPGSSF